MIDEHIRDDAERRILELQRARDQAQADAARWAYVAGQLHSFLRQATTDSTLLDDALVIVQQASAHAGGANHALLRFIAAANTSLQTVPHWTADDTALGCSDRIGRVLDQLTDQLDRDARSPQVLADAMVIALAAIRLWTLVEREEPA